MFDSNVKTISAFLISSDSFSEQLTQIALRIHNVWSELPYLFLHTNRQWLIFGLSLDVETQTWPQKCKMYELSPANYKEMNPVSLEKDQRKMSA